MELLRDTGADGESDAQDRSTQRELDRDRVFALLKNPRRRAVLRHLGETPTTTLSDLAERIAADENDTTPERLSSSERKRVYISLYQNHLPKLAEFDAIDYDQSRGDVRRRERACRLRQYLDRLDGDTDGSRGQVVRSLGGAVGLVSLVGVVGLPEVGTVWALVAAVALVGVSVYGHLGGDSPTAIRRWLWERLATLRQ